MNGLIGNERARFSAYLNSRNQLKGVFQCTLFEQRALTEPGTVQTVVLAACLLLVVYELRHGPEQTPCSIFSGLQF